MDDFFRQVKKVKIDYFTGTGSTSLVADCLRIDMIRSAQIKT